MRHVHFALVVPVALAVAVGCASGGGAAAPARCATQPADSVYRSGAPVFRDCAVDRAARLLNPSIPISWQPAAGPRSAGTRCYEAMVEFVVDTAGTPEVETARIIRQNEPGFARAVLASLPDWRYQPAHRSGQPVRQIVRERRTRAMVVTIAVVPAGTAATAIGTKPPTAPRC